MLLLRLGSALRAESQYNVFVSRIQFLLAFGSQAVSNVAILPLGTGLQLQQTVLDGWEDLEENKHKLPI